MPKPCFEIKKRGGKNGKDQNPVMKQKIQREKRQSQNPPHAGKKKKEQ